MATDVRASNPTYFTHVIKNVGGKNCSVQLTTPDLVISTLEVSKLSFLRSYSISLSFINVFCLLIFYFILFSFFCSHRNRSLLLHHKKMLNSKHISVIRTFGNNFLNKWKSSDEAYQNTVNRWAHCLLNHLLNAGRGMGFDSLKAFFVDKKPLELPNKRETDFHGVEFSAVRRTQCMLGMWKTGYSSCLSVCHSARWQCGLSHTR